MNREVKNASNNGAAFVLQMDGNLWAGKDIIKNDPRSQNQNGKYFEKFLNENSHLTVVNALPLCTGLITRRRNTKSSLQESVLDFYVVCDKIMPLVTKMTIDELGQHSLTKYYRGNIVKTDHCRLDMEVDLVFHKDKEHGRENAFNVRNKTCQEKFFEYTSNTNMFTNCFTSDKPFDHKFKTWQAKFRKSLFACFRKVRLTENVLKPSKINDLINEKKMLLKQAKLNSDSVEDKIEVIDQLISKECEDKEYEKLVKVVSELETECGGIDLTNVWKQFLKAYPKKTHPIPTGIKNISGKVVTNPDEKKSVTLEHFKFRMRERPVHKDAKKIAEIQENTFKMRLEEARTKKSLPFSMSELDKVLKGLKNGKSKDSQGYICELFKEGVIGNNLKESLLMMFNHMKDELTIPECLRTAHVTILHKKNCRMDLSNWRGIFVCSVLRNILMKLIYGRTYEKVDNSMTYSQI